MKLPLSWLTSLVDVDLDVDPLVEVMSLNGLEVEAVTRPGAGTVGVRTARVLQVDPHPDADALRVVRVTDGDGELQVVCGASNFVVGDVVLHATPGAFVPGVAGPGGQRGLELAARDIRGVRSAGMLASARELELGDDHDGIVVLPSSTPVGAELDDLVATGEPVIEIAVQPDRGDHLGVLGVARDLAAILDTTWSAPGVPDAPDGPTLPVEIATAGCASFHTWVVDGVEVGPSPLWMRHRLAQCGLRSIDTVVDVTNLVMLELGQPLHAFDLARLRGPSLRVRESTGGEALTTLDGQERDLVAGDLVIDDAEGPVSLAGVMGGLSSEVVADTTQVLFEAAVWSPTAIRATSRRLGLVSEASQRFERGVDPAGAARAVARAAGLLAAAGPGRSVGSAVATPDQAPAFVARPAVRVDPDRLARLVALDLDAGAQTGLFERAGCRVVADDGALQVTPPSWRADLTRPADLAEEVARLHGYDRIPVRLPRLPLTGGLTPAQRLEREVRRAALAAGFHEAVTRPFVGEDAFVGVVPSAGRVRLANPLAQDASAMRPSLIDGLLRALRRNHGQGRPGVALVELGRLFRPADDPLADVLDAVVPGEWRWRTPDGAALPVQPRTVALAASGLQLGREWLDPTSRWSVQDLLAVVDEVAVLLQGRGGAQVLERQPVVRPGFHPGRTVALLLGGHEVGLVGQLHPTEAEARDLPEPVVVAELLLEAFLAGVPSAGHSPVQSPALVRHPAMTLDVALVAPEDVAYTDLLAAVREGAGALLDDVWWFDEYRGPQVGEDRRSVALRLRLQAPDRQLTDADADTVIDAVAHAAERRGALLRR